MKKHLPTLGLVLLSSAAMAADVSTSSAPQNYVHAGWTSIQIPGPSSNFDGWMIDGRYYVNRNIFVDLGYNRSSESGYTMYGITGAVGYSQAVGQGELSFSAGYTYLHVNVPVSEHFNQYRLRLAYDLDLGYGFSGGLSVTHFFNNDLSGADDTTAPAITLGYELTKGLALNVTYSTEDLVHGIPDQDGSWIVGLTYKF